MSWNDSSDNKPSQAYWDKRNASIERQVAVKAVAQLFQGDFKNTTEEDITKVFRLFVKLIRDG